MEDTDGALAPTSVWLAFSLARKLNAKIRRELRSRIPDPRLLGRALAAALDGDDSLLHNSGVTCGSSIVQAMQTQQVRRATDAAMRWQEATASHHLIAMDDPRYPSAVLATNDAPPLLYVRGNPELLGGPHVAIVGARKASTTAIEHTETIAGELSQAGLGIVSGLALGIDGASHRGCLARRGITIAVSAAAPERVYPPSHCSLAEEIMESGALITEFPLGANLRPYHFPRRNRLISGLSMGVVVIEAALPSGSLITARHALEQGREVMAMPGSVRNPQARGCHALIQQGAALIENANDVLAVLAPSLQHQLIDTKCQQNLPLIEPAKSIDADVLDPIATTLLDCLSYDPMPVDRLIALSGLPAGPVAGTLSALELSGLIAIDGGGRYSRC